MPEYAAHGVGADSGRRCRERYCAGVRTSEVPAARRPARRSSWPCAIRCGKNASDSNVVLGVDPSMAGAPVSGRSRRSVGVVAAAEADAAQHLVRRR